MPTRRVVILLFDEVEVLDFAGPFEVFSVTGRRDGSNPFEVSTVAEKSPITTRNGLSINPSHTLADCPQPDVLVVPGGFGTRREMLNAGLLEWIGKRAAEAEMTLSVCTGALLLAKAGLLDGLKATTHHLSVDLLRQAAPNSFIEPERRVIDNGRIVAAAGVSAGIDASFHVVARFLGKKVALETARHIEYDWTDEGE